MLFRFSNEEQACEQGVAFYLLWSSSCFVWQDEKPFVAASPNSLSFIVIKVSARPREAVPAVSWRWSRASLGGQTQLQDPLCYSKVCVKGLEEEVVLTGAWGGLTNRLACSGGRFNLKRCLWASLWGFSSFHICWLNVSFCLHLSGLWIKSIGSSLQSTGESLLEKHCARVVLLLWVVGKNISSSAFSNLLYILAVAIYFSKLVFEVHLHGLLSTISSVLEVQAKQLINIILIYLVKEGLKREQFVLDVLSTLFNIST